MIIRCDRKSLEKNPIKINFGVEKNFHNSFQILMSKTPAKWNIFWRIFIKSDKFR